MNLNMLYPLCRTRFLAFKQNVNNINKIIFQAKDFLKPIDINEYQDYMDFIFKPMDLSLLEKVCLNERMIGRLND